MTARNQLLRLVVFIKESGAVTPLRHCHAAGCVALAIFQLTRVCHGVNLLDSFSGSLQSATGLVLRRGCLASERRLDANAFLNYLFLLRGTT